MARQFHVKRVYAPAERGDGLRVLVDRLWPRGVGKSEAKIDHWMKELAPTSELRRWFGHDPSLWDEFCRRYEAELAGKAEQLEQLRRLARQGPLTLVFGARDELHNQAVVLRDLLAG
jgi:uncharacterized protein YeaO (DUF488 family)